jgi:hypothetical protein
MVVMHIFGRSEFINVLAIVACCAILFAVGPLTEGSRRSPGCRRCRCSRRPAGLPRAVSTAWLAAPYISRRSRS